MAADTKAINLPEGFELDDQPKLPEGFELDKEPTDVKGMAEAAIRGGAQGASMGFADELAGMTGTVKDYLKRKFAGKTAPEQAVEAVKPGSVIGGLADIATSVGSGAPEYTAPRDEYRAADKAAAEAHPVTYGAGNLAGGASTMLIPGLNTVSAAKMAALGGMAGLGGSNADLTKGGGKDAAVDVVGGAAMGGLLGKAGEYIGPAAEKTAGMLKNAATNTARRAIGYSKRFINKQGLPRANEVARTMLDEGAIPWTGGAEETLKRIQDIADKSGMELGRVRELLDEMGVAGVPRKQALKGLTEMLPTQKGGVYDDITKHIMKARDTVAAHGKEIPFGEAEDLKKLLWEAGGNTDEIQSKAFRGASSAIRKATESKLDESAKMLDYLNPQRTDNIKFADYMRNKKLYGAAADASDVAMDKVNREAGNSFPSLRGTIAAGSRLGAGDIMGAAGALGVTETALRRGAGFAANAADRMADIVKKSPKILGRFAPVLTNAMSKSPATFAVTHYLLGQQEPEYQEMMKKIQEGEINESTENPR